MKTILLTSFFILFYNLSYTQEVVFPSDSGVLNIKNAPFNAVGDGIVDDTQAIKNALLAATVDYRYINMTVYIPNGTYLISEQIYWPQNGNGVPMFVQIQGQSEAETILKLKDNCIGFTNRNAPKEIMVTGCCSENAFRNSIRNLTINSGIGNFGASGLSYFASNTGICEFVSIISGDGFGVSGLILPPNTGPSMVSNVTIKGFDDGIYSRWGNLTTLENIKLENQKVYGFHSEGGRNAIRKLQSINSVIAIQVTSGEGQTTLIDSDLQGNNTTLPAIYCEHSMYIRNTSTSGYSNAVSSSSNCSGNIPIGMIEEWNFKCVYNTLFDIGVNNFDLPVVETPEVTWEQDQSKWANVITFGADPTGVQDCTVAIQAAINSGATTVYFPTGIDYRYYITGTIEIKGNVSRIIGCEARIPYSPNAKFKLVDSPQSPNTVIFERFQGDSSTNLQPTLEQASSNRTFVLKSIADWNVLGNGTGNIFIQDMTGRLYPNTSGANIWARQLNNENFTINNLGAKLWILGMKVEANDFTWINTSLNGTTELLGFLDYHSGGGPLTVPQFINNESTVQILPANFLTFGPNSYEVSVRETQNGVTRNLTGVGWSGYYYKGKQASSLNLETSRKESLISGIKLYPNPANESVNLNYRVVENEIVKITIFDIYGKEVKKCLNEFQEVGEHILKMDTSKLSSGMYFISIENKNIKTFEKLIVNNNISEK